MANEQDIITVFQALIEVHETFNELAVKKLDIVKKGNMQALDELLKEEATLIQQLGKLENTRQHVVQAWMQDKGFVKEDVRFEQLLNLFPHERVAELQQLEQRLVLEIKKLKEQNDLNQQLLEESLRFVNMSLDAMQPQQEFNNYQKPSGKNKNDDFEAEGRSLFDSKV